MFCNKLFLKCVCAFYLHEIIYMLYIYNINNYFFVPQNINLKLYINTI